MQTFSSSRRWWALAALVTSVLTIGLDGTVLNVALPTLATDLLAGTDELQWIVDAYLITMAALMLPAGLLGDRLGRKRLLLGGLGLFLLASLAAAFAKDTDTLVIARAAMGAGAAIIMPVSMAVLPTIFGPEERGRAIAIWTGGTALGLPLGPVLGGYLLEHFWWGSVFLINVPIIAIAVTAASLLLPESRDPAAPTLRPLSTALAVIGLAAAVFGVIQAPVDGWTDPIVLSTTGAGLLTMGGFIAVQRYSRKPMVDLTLFQRPAFLWGTVAAVFVSLTLAGTLFVTPQYLQIVLGYGTLDTGVRLVPMIGGLMAGGLASERIVTRLGVRVVVTSGMVVLAIGFALGTITTTTSGYAVAATWLAVVGLGIGLSLPPVMDAILATVPEAQAGAGSGLLQAMRQVGGALGVAVLGSLLSWAYVDRLEVSGLPENLAREAQDSIAAATAIASRLDDPALLAGAHSAFVEAMTVVLVACSAGALAGAVLVGIFLPGRRPTRSTSENVSHEPAWTPGT